MARRVDAPASSPFDEAAASYDRDFTDTPLGEAARRLVRESLQPWVPTCGLALDLGCGTGEDALWLASTGLRVVAADVSRGMLEVAGDKAGKAGLTERIELRRLDLNELPPVAEERYDLVLADFGVVNCVRDLPALGGWLARASSSGATVALVPMGRFCPLEMLIFLAQLRPGAAFRRLRAGGRSGGVPGGGSIPVWFPSTGTIRKALAPELELVHRRAVGWLLPPSWIPGGSRIGGGLLRRLAAWDRRGAAWPLLRSWGDHQLLVFRRR